MPAQPAWFHRLDEILTVSRSIESTRFDRQAGFRPSKQRPLWGDEILWRSYVMLHTMVRALQGALATPDGLSATRGLRTVEGGSSEEPTVRLGSSAVSVARRRPPGTYPDSDPAEQASDLDECIGNSVRDPRASPSVRYPLPQSNGYGIWAARQLQACVSWPLAKGAS